MDEVKTMSRAGENVGRAVGTGVKGARHGAVKARTVGSKVSRQAAALAEQELAARGISTDDLQERIAQRATGMSRKELAKRGKKARKEWDKRTAKQRKQLAKSAEAARKELAGRIDPGKPKRRKWPWALLVLAGLAAAAAAALSRRPEELPLDDGQFSGSEPQDHSPTSTENGQVSDKQPHQGSQNH
ncbi:hypothetical protein CDG81_00095 [Actinopolyspora erythraea]|uniref:DUF3618 domain-containing protein n=1 Tax=Actinopolyspora erythraea TaxID=414996 RepID=A0A099DAX9_9ACTN|nr:hypothetical protein [Actinopolyspora erythraea]ASU76997.1 hypothetical protein CDG81_00095 [Actinopolyspora erythraea]KGI83006.1 hypothetical protein IL38_01575 [Actinopolyspora erythraea]